MPNGTNAQLLFPSLDRRKIEASFEGGNVSSDGGLLLLRQLEERLRLIKDFSRVLPDDRHPSLISHSLEELLRERIFGLAQAYEDLNDHDTLRHDLLWQSAVHRDTPQASSPTLCQLEKRADRQSAVAMRAVFVENFIASFSKAPKRLILDFDATDNRVHGHQEGRFFHGYYGDYCFLPLYVFCNDQLLVSYLRPSNIDGARHAWAILKLLVTRLRVQWPEVRILFRADSGFCRQRMLNWCDGAGVDYVIGVARNARLEGTELARALVGTIRLTLLKIGTVIVRNTRWIRLLLSSANPYQALFA